MWATSASPRSRACWPDATPAALSQGRGLACVAEVSLAKHLLFVAESPRIEAQHPAPSTAATLAFAAGQLG
jgi:hypothetical protein